MKHWLLMKNFILFHYKNVLGKQQELYWYSTDGPYPSTSQTIIDTFTETTCGKKQLLLETMRERETHSCAAEKSFGKVVKIEETREWRQKEKEKRKIGGRGRRMVEE